MDTTEEHQLSSSSMIINKKKGGKGRQKIEIKKITRTSNRQVSFSKRRKSLFKNAEDLSLKCRDHARVAVFALSENGRPYSYGNSPDADTLIDQFLGVGNGCNYDTARVMVSQDLELERYRASLLEEREEVEKILNENMMVSPTTITDDVTRLVQKETMNAELGLLNDDFETSMNGFYENNDVSACTSSGDVTRLCDVKNDQTMNCELGLLYDDFETWMNGFYENNNLSACTSTDDETRVLDVKNDQTMNNATFETWMNDVFESIDHNLELFNDDINNLGFF